MPSRTSTDTLSAQIADLARRVRRLEGAVTAVNAPVVANLIPNPGVEVNATGWTFVSDYVTATIARSTEQARSGVASLKLTITSYIGGEETPEQIYVRAPETAAGTIVPGRRYAANMGVRFEATGTTDVLPVLAIEWLASDGTVVSVEDTGSKVVPRRVWGYVAVEGASVGTAPAGASKARLSLSWGALQGPSGVGTTVYYDDARLDEA